MESIRDITIGWEKGDKYAEVNTPNCRIKSRLQKLYEKYPDEFQRYIENKDGSLYAKIPVKWIKIGRPRTVSDEQREAARERFARSREVLDAMLVENPNTTLGF